MSFTDSPLASLKAKESSTTTLLLGVASLWVLSLNSGLDLTNSYVRPTSTIIPKLNFTGSGLSSSQVSEITFVTSRDSYVPKTALGKKLVALREAAIAKGMHLMTSDEISAEIARRRGEIV